MSKSALFDGSFSVTAKAVLLGDSIDIQSLDTSEFLAKAPPVLKVGKTGCVTLFRYGAVVLFDLDEEEQEAFLARIDPLVRGRLEHRETEELDIRLEPKTKEVMDKDVLVLNSMDVERVQVASYALAETVCVDHYEGTVSKAFRNIEPLVNSLRQCGKVPRKSRELLQQVGSSLFVEHKMVNRVEVAENPDMLWDRPELERVYSLLVHEYELKERRRSLEKKLELNIRTIETVIELIRHDSFIRVEWYIVLLIIVEIVIMVYESL